MILKNKMLCICPVVGKICSIEVTQHGISFSGILWVSAILERRDQRIKPIGLGRFDVGYKPIHFSICHIHHGSFCLVRSSAGYVCIRVVGPHALACDRIGHTHRRNSVPHRNSIRSRVRSKIFIKGAIFLKNDDDMFDRDVCFRRCRPLLACGLSRRSQNRQNARNEYRNRICWDSEAPAQSMSFHLHFPFLRGDGNPVAGLMNQDNISSSDKLELVLLLRSSTQSATSLGGSVIPLLH